MAWLAAGLLLVVAACGKRGNPLAPIRVIPAQTNDLAVQQLGSELLLSLGYPTTTVGGGLLHGLEALEIFRLELPIFAELVYEEELEPIDEDEVEPEDDVGDEEAPEESPSEEEPEIEPEAQSEDDDASEADTEDDGEEDSEGSDDGEDEGTEDDESDADSEDEEVEEVRAPIDRRGFVGAVGEEPELTIEISELAAVTSGDRIAVRLPMAPPRPEEPVDEEPPVEGEEEPREIIGYYQVFGIRTRSLTGEISPFSNVAYISPRSPVAGPTSMELEPTVEGVAVSWQPAAIAEGTEILGYRVYRRGATERLYSQPLGFVENGETSFVDATAQYDERYIYSVRSVEALEPTYESGISTEQEIEYLDRFAPTPPENLDPLPEDGRVRLLWDPSPESDVAGYVVYRQDPSLEFRRLNDEPVPTPEYLDEGLTSGLTYTYRVTAVDEEGNESEPGEEESVVAR